MVSGRYSTVPQGVHGRYCTVQQEVPGRYCTVQQEVRGRYLTVLQEVSGRYILSWKYYLIITNLVKQLCGIVNNWSKYMHEHCACASEYSGHYSLCLQLTFPYNLAELPYNRS